MNTSPKKVYKTWKDYLENILIVLVLALLFRTFVVGTYKVEFPDMQPGLRVGDFILGFKMPYGVWVPFLPKKITWGVLPQVSEVVIFRDNSDGTPLRAGSVLGLPGDRIDAVNGKVLLNGQEVLTWEQPQPNSFLLKEDEILVRFTSPVEKEKPFQRIQVDQIESRAIFRWLSLGFDQGKKSVAPSFDWQRSFQKLTF